MRLPGEFWELKSRHLKIAKVEKHCHTLQLLHHFLALCPIALSIN